MNFNNGAAIPTQQSLSNGHNPYAIDENERRTSDDTMHAVDLSSKLQESRTGNNSSDSSVSYDSAAHVDAPRARRDTTSATHAQGIVYVQTPVRDPMAPSAAFSDDYWRETLSVPTMWTLKLALLVWVGASLMLFKYASGDPLAVQLVASISMLCILFYGVRVQSRAAHADKVAFTAAGAWISYSAFVAFSGRTLDHAPMAYVLRDFGLVLIVALIGVRYWLLNMSMPVSQQNTPLLHTVHQLWSVQSPWSLFCAEQIDDASSAAHYAPISPHISGAVDERAVGNHWFNASARPPYSRRPVTSPYISATQRALSMQTASLAQSDPAAKSGERRTHVSVNAQDLMHRIVGGFVALVHEILFWAFAVFCAMPLQNNSLFVESYPITTVRLVLFVFIYMVSDSMMDPATESAAVHVAPTLLILTSYVLFVSPWMLFASCLHVCVLGVYVVMHARAGDLPWSRWTCVKFLRREYISRFASGHLAVPLNETQSDVQGDAHGIPVTVDDSDEDEL